MNKPRYWKELEELEQSPEFLAQAGKEFPTDLTVEAALEQANDETFAFAANRRDFLKVFGFGITAATLSACFEAPTKKAIPYVNKPLDVVPGVANYYASTSSTGMPVLVKAREGRPIKLEGNPDSSLTRGGLSAVDHASLLSLYDVDRLQQPLKQQKKANWATVDGQIRQKLDAIMQANGNVRVLTGTVLSPATRAVIADFLADNPNAKHISYDAVSYYAIAKAHELDFGQKVIPSYRMENADVIASFSCDFLGTWLSPVEFSWKYMQKRNPDQDSMSRHFQFESLMTITGIKADLRFPIKPSDQGVALLNLYNKVAQRLGKPVIPGVPEFNVAMNALDKVAAELVAAQGRSLVLCGTNDLDCQRVVNAINFALGNYGEVIDVANPCLLKQGDDEALAQLAEELRNGQVNALFVYGANPAYNSPYAEVFKEAIPKLELSVSLASKEDDTSRLCEYVCPDSHYLESWNDVQQTATHYSLVQPTINPIFDTRQAQDSFLKWSGSTQKYSAYLKSFWQAEFFPQQTTFLIFADFWNESLRKGVMALPPAEAVELSADVQALAEVAVNLTQQRQQAGEGHQLLVYEKVSLRDGEMANNPWLQELPDPVSRVSWSNYLTVAHSDAQENGWKTHDVVRLKVGEKEVRTVVYVQPGQAKGTFGLALGYGREGAGRTAAQAEGVDAYPFVRLHNGMQCLWSTGAAITRTGQSSQLALIQKFNTLYDPAKGEQFGNDYDRTEHIIKETVFPFYHDPNTVNAEGHNPWQESLEEYSEKKKHLVTLWDAHFKYYEKEGDGHDEAGASKEEAYQPIHWAMAIDLNKCTGCGACVVSCQAENNVPVVGKDEVRRSRDMYWMRLDRYYSGDPDNPDVVIQPMLCQHCDNAPCETVCPVLATVHSKEGINQMAYNRCVGTRYCANNCPYKVRRFNWLNYTNTPQFKDINPAYESNKLGHLVLNPDVTVRFRGVMEKCSFCVQRLQEAKLRAKIKNDSTLAKPKDGEVQTACQQSCPTGAIIFGDRNDVNSEIHKLYKPSYWSEPDAKDPAARGYHALEEVKTLPSVKYMSLVRNRTVEEWEEKEEAVRKAQTYDKS